MKSNALADFGHEAHERLCFKFSVCCLFLFVHVWPRSLSVGRWCFPFCILVPALYYWYGIVMGIHGICSLSARIVFCTRAFALELCSTGDHSGFKYSNQDGHGPSVKQALLLLRFHFCILLLFSVDKHRRG